MRRGRRTKRGGDAAQTAAALMMVVCVAVGAGFLSVRQWVAPWLNGGEVDAFSGGTGETAQQTDGAQGKDETNGGGEAPATGSNAGAKPQDGADAAQEAEGSKEENLPQGTDTPQETANPQGTTNPQESTNSQGADAAQETAGAAGTQVVEDRTETTRTSGFAVQVGSFSTKEAASQQVQQLQGQGLSAAVIERDGAYKVVSQSYATKDEARAAAENWKAVTGDAFVVAI